MINTVVVQPSVKLIFTFTKFKMAANATSVKELGDLKQCCDPMNVNHSVSSKRKLRPVLDWIKKKDPSI
jgi:hypothetical protein